MLVNHFLENSAKRLPDKVALICGEERLTYSEINQRADQLAAALIDMGVKRQNRVIIFLDNSVESVISLFGIMKAGAIFIMLNATMKSKTLHRYLPGRLEQKTIVENDCQRFSMPSTIGRTIEK